MRKEKIGSLPVTAEKSQFFSFEVAQNSYIACGFCPELDKITAASKKAKKMN